MVVHADLTLIPISTSQSLIVASTTTPASRHTTPPHSQGGIPASRPTCCWREPWSSAPDQEGRVRAGSGGCRFARRQRSGRRPRRVCVVAQLRSSPPTTTVTYPVRSLLGHCCRNHCCTLLHGNTLIRIADFGCPGASSFQWQPRGGGGGGG